MTDLVAEAYELHGKLSRAYFEEDAKRDKYFNRTTSPLRLARLSYLTHKAADRWRRRKGIVPIWGYERRVPGVRIKKEA